MAKGKHAAALFDVINRKNPPARPVFRPATARSWWVFGRRRGPSATGLPGASVALSTSAAPMVAPPPTPSMPEPELPESGAEGVSLSVDGARQEVCLRFSYVSATIFAVALVVLLGVAYLFGRQARSLARPLLTDRTTEETRQNQPQPGLLALAQDGVPGTPAPADPTADRPGAFAPVAPPPTPGETRPPATFTLDDPRRTVGLNYVLVQSYPNEKMANEARDILTQNGVPCTVERNLPGWPGWYCVLGTKGFARVRNVPELEAYMATIRSVSEKHAGRRGFKAFSPLAVKWVQ